MSALLFRWNNSPVVRGCSELSGPKDYSSRRDFAHEAYLTKFVQVFFNRPVRQLVNYFSHRPETHSAKLRGSKPENPSHGLDEGRLHHSRDVSSAVK
jgi:hypothetical protein